MKTYADECLERAENGSFVFDSQEAHRLLSKDLPELARRLNRACGFIRSEINMLRLHYKTLADELEAPLADRSGEC